MRELRLVGPSDDAQHLVLEADDERFLLRNDAALRAAARSQTSAAPVVETPPPPRVAQPELPVGPREIQVRVRAGESPEDIAASYGVAIERIQRFAGPVLEERLRITDEARRARARRTGHDGAEAAVVAFGEAVDARYSAHGILPTEVTWDSRRREDGEWIVIARWSGAGSEHAAEWVFHRASRSVTPLDDTAGDLLSDRPIRPIVPPQPEPPRTSYLSAPPLRPGIVAFPPMPDAHTGPVPRITEEVFDQEAEPARAGTRADTHTETRPASQPDTATAAIAPPVRERTPEPTAVPIDEPAFEFDEPSLPLGLAEPEPQARPLSGLGKLRNLNAAKRDESDEERAARARVPSWDDILLGVRRKD